MSTPIGVQLVDTTGHQLVQPDWQTAMYVAALMIAGVIGLVAIGLIFRKHVEL